VRPFYGTNRRIKQYYEFHAHVVLNLRIICSQQYISDQFLDAIIHIFKDIKICLILTEQRILIVDALDKSKIKDLQAETLKKVIMEPVYARNLEMEEALEFSDDE
jgi:hypothetical protein